VTGALVVGVVTYDSADVLPGLVESLPAALSGVDSWRLVVADNASSDGTVDTVRRLAPDAEVVAMGGNLGYAAGVNACTAADPAADVLVLNPDIRLRPGSAARLRAAVAADPAVGIAVPRLLGTDGRLAPSLRRSPTAVRALGEALLGGTLTRRVPALGEVVGDPAAYRRPTTAEWASGAAMLLTRACLDAVGRWDESFFLYSEETDFALRAREAGYLLRLVPDAEAVHVGGEAHVSPPLWSLLVANKVRLHARRHGRAGAAAFWSAAAAGEAVRAAAGRGPAGRAPHRAALAVLLRERAALRRGEPPASVLGRLRAYRPGGIQPERVVPP